MNGSDLAFVSIYVNPPYGLELEFQYYSSLCVKLYPTEKRLLLDTADSDCGWTKVCALGIS